MPGSANKLRITERQQDVLKEISNSTTSALRLIQRANVILLAFAGEDNQDIAKEVGFDRNAVAKWRRRWAKDWQKLILIECEQSRAGLRRAIEDVLADAPRSGCPGIFTPEGDGKELRPLLLSTFLSSLIVFPFSVSFSSFV